MKFPHNSKKPEEVDISDFYAVRIKSLWKGFRQEHLSFWFLSAYFFFEYVRPQQIYPAIDIIPWAKTMLMATVISVYSDGSVRWVGNIENKLFILFCFIIVLSGIFAFSPSVSWGYWQIMFNWVLVYFLVILIVNSERRLFLFTLFYLMFSFKMAQHGFFVFARRGFSFTTWGLIGAGGWFQNSGEFAIQMLVFSTLAAAFVMALREHWESRFKRWFFYMMPFTGAMSVIGASSRGAQLALGVIGILLLIKSKAGVKTYFSIALIALLLYFFLPEAQIERFSSMGEDRTSILRLAFWHYGLEVMQEHPLLGIGYQNWLSYITFNYPQGYYMGSNILPHNIFIQAGAELGYTGLICFVLMVIYTFIINARTRVMGKRLDNKFLSYMSYGLDAGTVGYLVAGFFVTVLYYPFFWIQLAMTVALHVITTQQAAVPGEKVRKR
jgi:putative inorganic carbon (HCO3(-)) transporter